MRAPQREHWDHAIDKEMNAHLENGTWELIDIPKGRKAIGSKLVYRLKRNPVGSIQRYKTRLVVQGCQQKAGIASSETYAPVVDFTTVRTVLAMAARAGMYVYQMNDFTAFLNGNLDEETYMRIPTVVREKYGPRKVCLLRKSLYGVKQAPRFCFNSLKIL